MNLAKQIQAALWFAFGIVYVTYLTWQCLRPVLAAHREARQRGQSLRGAVVPQLIVVVPFWLLGVGVLFTLLWFTVFG